MTRRRSDLTIGVVVGIVLGIAVLAAFVFLGSEGSIDAPRISGVHTGKPAQTTQSKVARPAKENRLTQPASDAAP
jgi:hypothetical protein